MYTILLGQGVTIEISEEVKHEIVRAGKDGRIYEIKDTGDVISLRPMPTIVRTERAREADRSKLSLMGKFRCDYGNLHSHEERCECGADPKNQQWEHIKFRPLVAPRVMKRLRPPNIPPIPETHGVKHMPEPSYQERLEERAKSGDTRAQTLISNQS